MNGLLTMMTFPQYDRYRGRFNIGLIIFFTILTFTFGYLRHEMSETARNYGQFLIIGVIVSVFISFWLKVKLTFSFKYSSILYVLLTWLFLIQFFREDLPGSAKNFFNILFTQVLIIVVSNILWRIPFERLINIFLIYLHACLLLSVYVHITNVGPLELGNHNEDVRFGGLFFFGITGILAGVGAILSSYRFFVSETGNMKAKYLFSTLVFIFYTLASDMRTVLFAIVVAIFVQYLFKRRAQNKSIFPIIVLAGLFYAMLKIYNSYSEGSDVERDFGVREVIWSVGQKMIKDQPLVGYGTYSTDMSRISLADTRYSDLFVDLKLPDPHSSFLSLMIQSGLVTFAIFLFLLAKIVQLSKRYSPINKMLLSIIAFWLVCGTTGGNYFDFNYSIQGVAFELTIFAFMLHPELVEPTEENEETHQEDAIQRTFSRTSV